MKPEEKARQDIDNRLKKAKRKYFAPKALVLFLLYYSVLIPLFAFSHMESAQFQTSKHILNKIKGVKIASDIFIMEPAIQLENSVKSYFALITDFAIDTKKNFIICDGWQSGKVLIFSPTGRFLRLLGGQGQGPGEYNHPVSLDISSRLEIYVTDYLRNQINIYDKDYSFMRSIFLKPRIKHFLHLNSRDEIYMYSGARGIIPKIFDTIHKYSSEGVHISSFAPFPKKVLEVNMSAAQDGMIIGEDDFIYEMNPLYYQIRKYSPSGELVNSFSRKTRFYKIITKEGEIPIIVNGPFFLENGLILAQVNNHLEIFDINGNFIAGEIPFPYKIIGTHTNTLYTELWEESENPENQPNPKIIPFRLKF